MAARGGVSTRTTMNGALVVTIDTEEEGCFAGQFTRSGHTCRNVLQLPRLHALFRRLGVVPTYLVDYPVAADRAARELLRGFIAEGATEIGAHLHPWCNPPFEPVETPDAHRLPPWLQEAKLHRLCTLIEGSLGVRPRVYRAGRWGFDASTVPLLERLGIRVDTSVNRLWWSQVDGGPAFASAPLAPYRLDRGDVCRPGTSSVVEVPTSTLVARPWGIAVERALDAGPWRRRRPRGLQRLLRSLGLASLKPERYSLESMLRVADALAARGVPVFNVMLHSSALLPGATPYVPDARALERFCARVEGLLEQLLARHAARPCALSQLPQLVGLSGGDQVAA
jgi:hypothetical protein